MLPDIASLLEEQRQATKAVERARDVIVPWVFHRNGKTIRDFRGAWEAACKAAGCPGASRTTSAELRCGISPGRTCPNRSRCKSPDTKHGASLIDFRIVDEADLRDGLRSSRAHSGHTDSSIALKARRAKARKCLKGWCRRWESNPHGG